MIKTGYDESESINVDIHLAKGKAIPVRSFFVQFFLRFLMKFR